MLRDCASGWRFQNLTNASLHHIFGIRGADPLPGAKEKLRRELPIADSPGFVMRALVHEWGVSQIETPPAGDFVWKSSYRRKN